MWLQPANRQVFEANTLRIPTLDTGLWYSSDPLTQYHKKIGTPYPLLQ